MNDLATIRRKSPAGAPTNDLVFSAYQDGNEDVFPLILSLYVGRQSRIADVTYGRGVFWRNVDPDAYDLEATDLSTGTDARDLPYEDGSIDCVVFDPPYMHTPGGTAHSNHQNFEQYYRNNGTTHTEKKYHEAVLDLYFKAADEAHRVLRDEGFYIVKCQDEVCANRQRLTHVEIINELATKGFVCEDLFVVMRKNRPGVSRSLVQAHARKNHSYFLIFWKAKATKRWKGIKPCGLVLEINSELAQDAFEEALKRYPDAHGALIFLWGASGLGLRNPTPEDLERARKRWGDKHSASGMEARRAATAQQGAVHDSPVAKPDAQTLPPKGDT